MAFILMGSTNISKANKRQPKIKKNIQGFHYFVELTDWQLVERVDKEVEFLQKQMYSKHILF